MAQIQPAEQNKMGYMPVNRLLLTMSLPIMASMLVQALYNIVDSMFVAKLSMDALTAVSLAFPVQNLMIAIATGTGVGINAMLSKSLGERDFEKANKTAENGLFLAFLSMLLFVIFGLFFPGIFYRLQTDNPEIIAYGTSYLRICTIGSIGLFGQIALERLLQSTGKTIYTMFMQGSGAIVNIILDYCLIFGKFGMPRMGVSGAAVATIIGQMLAMGLGVLFNLRHNHEITLRLQNFKPEASIIGRIYSVGLPSILMASISSIMTFGINNILIRFSEVAVSVFGVYFKLQSFIFMPVFGLNNGMVPIIAYNYGAQDCKRILRTIKLSICYAVSLMVAGFLVFQFRTAWLLSLFDASEEMLHIGIPALRIISISFLFAGFCIISISSQQALGDGISSLIISATRQLVFLLPIAFLLSKTGNVERVWWAFPIAELASLALSLFFLYRAYQQKLQPLLAHDTEQAKSPYPIPKETYAEDLL